MPKIILAVNNKIIKTLYDYRVHGVDLNIEFKSGFLNRLVRVYKIPYEQWEPFNFTIYKVPFKLIYGKYNIYATFSSKTGEIPPIGEKSRKLLTAYILKPQYKIVLDLKPEYGIFAHNNFDVVSFDNVGDKIWD